MTIEQQIRNISKHLLDEGTVDMIVGYGEGTLPCTTMPLIITTADEADGLVWNPFCVLNLARYVQKETAQARANKDAAEPAIGVVAKKCDARALVELIREKQINREKLVIIGVPCTGMFEKRTINDKVGGREILDVAVDGDTVTFRGRGFEVTCERDELIRDNCIVCKEPENLPIVDERLGEEEDVYKKPFEEDDFSDVEEHEKLSPRERWEAFKSEFEHCIRCYACRNACPMCYCEECFAESSQPRWLGGSVALEDVLFFQTMRLYHQAGRCVDCGACQAVCPINLDIRTFLRKLNRDAVELFQFAAGESPGDKPLLSTFDTEDKQEFITEPEE